MKRTFHTIAELEDAVGRSLGPGDWFTVDQSLVDGFADLTDDHEWLHVDIERARASEFGGTIAHGYLTLALIPLLGRSVYEVAAPGQLVNYGLQEVRFPAPLPVGSRARSHITPVAVTRVERGLRITLRHSIEVEGQDRPACVATTLFLLLDDSGADTS